MQQYAEANKTIYTYLTIQKHHIYIRNLLNFEIHV